MKYLKLIILLFSLQTINAQQIDTLTYVKQFEINKANYIGKPFSVLLNDMNTISPKTVWVTPNPNNKNNIKNSRFKFATKEKSFKNAITLLITWKDFVPFKDIEYLSKKNKFYFTDEEKNFYGTKIIQDITVYR
ncbi:hypothetical protein HX001_13745 [Empedobacter brevis]|uniref:Uncharacterized protein n=1 Tax=Empedobacter brevis TaxID=247 RepID=A0AAJ1V8N1_9FLAO|nr:hypothetical protein [Empedobacter brevis]MDM1073549.1 hypothetical protein [Empedobacter brevis]